MHNRDRRFRKQDKGPPPEPVAIKPIPSIYDTVNRGLGGQAIARTTMKDPNSPTWDGRAQLASSARPISDTSTNPAPGGGQQPPTVAGAVPAAGAIGMQSTPPGGYAPVATASASAPPAQLTAPSADLAVPSQPGGSAAMPEQPLTLEASAPSAASASSAPWPRQPRSADRPRSRIRRRAGWSRRARK